MKALILAAGRGSRMGNLTDDRPKCLVELGSQTLLSKQLSALRAAGIESIGIVTGYQRELLVGFGLTEFHNPRWQETNMVSSLACAESWLSSEPCIVSYSDIFYQASAVSALSNSSASLAVTYDVNWHELWTRRFGDPLADAETFRLHDDGTVAEIGNKPTALADIEGQYMGLLRFTPEGWCEVARIRAELTNQERDKMHMTATLQRVIAAGRMAVSAIPYDRPWGEVDSSEDICAYI